MKRAVRAVIRLVAVGFILWGGMEIALQFLRHHLQKADFSPGQCMLGAILAGLGVLLLAASKRLAEQWTDDFDE